MESGEPELRRFSVLYLRMCMFVFKALILKHFFLFDLYNLLYNLYITLHNPYITAIEPLQPLQM